VAAEQPDQAAEARLVAGLYAHAAGDLGLARELLAAGSNPDSALEDWRLYLLAETAIGGGEPEVAREAYARLIAGFPSSPLRPLASLESAELARRQRQPHLALALIGDARKAGLEGKMAGRLESLAWRIGRETANPAAQRQAARGLLMEAPLSSDAQEAARAFHAFSGGVDWDLLLSSDDSLRRARSLLDSESAEAALSTLDGMDPADRSFEWRLLKARALTDGRRGLEALALLEDAMPLAAEQQAALEWERALAAADAATARGGRENLSTPERRRLFAASHHHLANVVRSHADLQLSKEALRTLYEDYMEADLFDPALDALRALRRIDPEDGTGTAHLWERGWAEYQGGNLTGAVGVWSEMEDVYPSHRATQRARYWKGRALEELGHKERARGVYRDLVTSSDTSDFYLRQALSRLGVAPEADRGMLVAASSPGGPWPAGTRLQRAKLLTDLGLDELAQREMELAAGRANPRDLLALKALILCRTGERRSGLVLLREAYPALGGPYQASVPEEILRAYYPLEYTDDIRANARRTGLPPSLVAGIIRQESAFDPRATSPVGARGLMQLMPATAREVSGKVGLTYVPERLYAPEVSVHLGTTYFREVLNRFDGNVELALAGYNGGPNRIRRLWKEAGPHVQLDSFLENLGLDESRNYVKRILVLADSYRQLYPVLGS
jgi:soluble lytic murein transglycosylase